VGTPYKIGIASALQIVPDGRAYQSAMTGNVYFGVFL